MACSIKTPPYNLLCDIDYFLKNNDEVVKMEKSINGIISTQK